MATCANCNKKVIIGGVKDGNDRYCSHACRFQNFYGKFESALAVAVTANPEPLPDNGTQAETESPEIPEAASSTVIDSGKDLMIILLGASVSLAIAGVIYLLADRIGYPFHAQTLSFVVPIGAYLCGLVAGGGFWYGIRQLDRLPGRNVYLAAGFVGATSYLLIYILMWWLMEFNGAKVRDQIGFGPFLQHVIEHQRMRLARGGGNAFELGKWGYAKFALNVAGFVAGVLTTVAIGGGKAYCSNCKRYLKSVGKQIRSSSDPEQTAVALHPVIYGIAAGRLQEAVYLHGVSGVPGGKKFWTTTITVEACPNCGKHLAILKATVPGENGAQNVEGFVFQGESYEPVRLPI